VPAPDVPDNDTRSGSAMCLDRGRQSRRHTNRRHDRPARNRPPRQRAIAPPSNRGYSHRWMCHGCLLAPPPSAFKAEMLYVAEGGAAVRLRTRSRAGPNLVSGNWVSTWGPHSSASTAAPRAVRSTHSPPARKSSPFRTGRPMTSVRRTVGMLASAPLFSSRRYVRSPGDDHVLLSVLDEE